MKAVSALVVSSRLLLFTAFGNLMCIWQKTKNYSAHALHHSILVWRWGRSVCSSPYKELVGPVITSSGWDVSFWSYSISVYVSLCRRPVTVLLDYTNASIRKKWALDSKWSDRASNCQKMQIFAPLKHISKNIFHFLYCNYFLPQC